MEPISETKGPKLNNFLNWKIHQFISELGYFFFLWKANFLHGNAITLKTDFQRHSWIQIWKDMENRFDDGAFDDPWLNWLG